MSTQVAWWKQHDSRAAAAASVYCADYKPLQEENVQPACLEDVMYSYREEESFASGFDRITESLLEFC